MIGRIEGVLESISGGVAEVSLQGAGITLQVMVPAYTAARLGGNLGSEITLHTLFYMEAQGQGTNMWPRLAGFLTVEDRNFFELFTTCKGIGNRKALRAMSLPAGQIAAAIADRDTSLLQSLPEIGKRTAETIVASLRGKVDDYITTRESDSSNAAAGGDEETASSGSSSIARDVLGILTNLGENRVQAAAWIDQVMAADDNRPTSSDELLSRVFQIKNRV